MPVLNAVRNHPLRLVLSLLLAFGAWVAYDASSGPRCSNEPLDAPPVDTPRVAELPIPQMNDHSNSAQARDNPHSVVVTADLRHLQPGMPRIEIEKLIGPPHEGLVYPVAMVDGKFIYRASYSANLGSSSPASAPVARTVISLEFDAGRPGHPLLAIQLPSR